MEISKIDLVATASGANRTRDTKNTTSGQDFQKLFSQRTAQGSDSSRNDRMDRNTVQSTREQNSSRDVQNTSSRDKVQNTDSQQEDTNSTDNVAQPKDQNDHTVDDKKVKVDKKAGEKTETKAENVKEDKEEALEEKGKASESDAILSILSAMLSGKMSIDDAAKQTEGTPAGDVIQIIAAALKDNSNAEIIKTVDGKVDPNAELLKMLAGKEAALGIKQDQKNSKDDILNQIVSYMTEKNDSKDAKTEKLSKMEAAITAYIAKSTEGTSVNQEVGNKNTKVQELLNAIQEKLQTAKEGASNAVNENKEIKTAVAATNLKDKAFLNSKKEESNDIQEQTAGENETVSTIESIKVENSNGSSAKKEETSSNNSSLSSDDKLLKSLISDNKDNKINKLTTFMTQFNNVAVKDNVPVNETGDKIVVNRANMAADMIKAVKYMESNNLKDLTVKINPEELGEVIIKLTVESGVMKANITATNKDAYSLLNANLADMNSKLNNNDIKIQNFTVNIYNGDTTFFKDGSRQNNQGSGQQGRRNPAVGGVEEEISNPNPATLEDSNVNILA